MNRRSFFATLALLFFSKPVRTEPTPSEYVPVRTKDYWLKGSVFMFDTEVPVSALKLPQLTIEKSGLYARFYQSNPFV